jgi:lipoate-protein ligase A
MAVDHALARELVPGVAVLRLYRWERPTVSFGRNEPARGIYDAGRADSLGVALVRRPTGGRAVLHHRELTYSVTVPVGALGGLRATYLAVNEALVGALRALGASVQIAPGGGPPLRPAAGPCFDVPAAGEVVASGRKLVGSAQVRIGRTVLQHGSIILSGDQSAIRSIGGGETVPPATLEEQLGEVPSAHVLEQTVIGAFQERFQGTWSTDDLAPGEREAARKLERQYASPEWTWRR